MHKWPFVIGLLLTCCGTSDDGPASDGGFIDAAAADATTTDATTTDATTTDATTADATTADATTTDATTADAGVCHGAGFGAPAAAFRIVASLPAAIGGAIPPGSYDAVDVQTTGSLTGSFRSTWVIAATTLDSYEQLTLNGTPPAPRARSFTFTAANTHLVRTATCGGATNFDNEYSVRVVGAEVFLDIKENTIMFTYRKR